MGITVIDDRRPVELRDLKYFLAVAEERSFTRGAQRAGIVQSAASAAVHRLERELGQRLLDRGTRGVELTDAGRLVLDRARTMLGDARAVRDDLDALAGGLRGSVTLGTVLSTGELDLPAILTGFHHLHPGVSVRLRLSAGPENQHLHRLLDGEFDLSLVPQPDQPPAGVTITSVAQMRLVLVCRREDALARARDVRYRDIAPRDYIDFPSPWGNRALVDGLFQSDGITRHVAFEVVDVESAIALIRGGLGIGFLPDHVTDSQPDLVAVDLCQPPPRRRLGLAAPADRPLSAATTALRRAIIQAAATR